MSDEEALRRLGALRDQRGLLSAHVLNGASGLPGADGFRQRFGSLEAAYQLVGYDPAGLGPYRPRHDPRYTRASMIAGLQRLLSERGHLTVSMVDADPRLPCRATFQRRFGRVGVAFELAGYRVKGLRGVAAASHRTTMRRGRRAAAAVRAAALRAEARQVAEATRQEPPSEP